MMDDECSLSSESLATSEEFEFVGEGEPEFQITGGHSNQLNLLQDVEDQVNEEMENKKKEIFSDSLSEKISQSEMTSNGNEEKHEKEDISEKSNNILQEKKFGKMTLRLSDGLARQENSDKELESPVCSSSSSTPTEEGPLSKSASLQFPEERTLFSKVTYLGCAATNAPRSKNEIFRNMAILNEQSSEHAIEVTVSLPNDSESSVILYEDNESTEMATFAIHRILFCARGRPETQEDKCFAFTCSHGNTAESAIFQCHVFRCDGPDTVMRVLKCFARAFRNPKLAVSRCNSISSEKSMPIGNTVRNNEQVYVFEASLEIKEEDSKGVFVTCPKDKEYFKLRCNLEKLIVMTVHQISNNKELVIERCFGLLISPGRNVSQDDMHPLEMVSMTKLPVGERSSYQISGQWNPAPAVFELLNTETPRDSLVYLTVAIDIVFTGVQESIRLAIETKAKIFSQTDRFWYFTKKPIIEQFYVRLREVDAENIKEHHSLEVVNVDSASQLQRKRANLSMKFGESCRRGSTQSTSTVTDQETESDNDEPLLSGTGDVSKDCTELELEGWADVLAKWQLNLTQRPKQLAPLVRRGIPEALRGEAWQLLAGCHDARQMIETYRVLITKDSPCENVIQRDINRTFPAHEYFRESGGIGQDSLYKICKAYSVYDQEIGYCQSMSFLAAALLLHMPEEQAFNVLVRIMFDYHLRDLFRNGFEELHTKLFILERLMEEQLPEVYAHFLDLGVEAHMFASQWFLTLFTAKFPLYVVFYIVDIFLLDGIDTLFQVAVALLSMSKKDLLALDFEGILKHFRVSLPKKYRTEESARLLLQAAVGVKLRKLKKYKKEYSVYKEQQKQQEDPVDRLKRENKRLLESNMHLEQENDDLAQELVMTRMQLKKELEMAEEQIDALTKELQTTKTCLAEMDDEKKRLDVEVAQLKGMCRRELQRAETEIARNTSIISEYKQICGQLNARFEKEQKSSNRNIEQLKGQMKACTQCSKLLDIAYQPEICISDGVITTSPLSDNHEQQIRELELELAQTKLALVEAECKNQDLNHQMNVALAELQASKNTWLHKTLSSIRDATKKEYPVNKEVKEKDPI